MLPTSPRVCSERVKLKGNLIVTIDSSGLRLGAERAHVLLYPNDDLGPYSSHRKVLAAAIEAERSRIGETSTALLYVNADVPYESLTDVIFALSEQKVLHQHLVTTGQDGSVCLIKLSSPRLRTVPRPCAEAARASWHRHLSVSLFEAEHGAVEQGVDVYPSFTNDDHSIFVVRPVPYNPRPRCEIWGEPRELHFEVGEGCQIGKMGMAIATHDGAAVRHCIMAILAHMNASAVTRGGSQLGNFDDRVYVTVVADDATKFQSLVAALEALREVGVADRDVVLARRS